MMKRTLRILSLLPVCLSFTGVAAGGAEPLRVGVIGLDTSHATEFNAIINTPRPAGADRHGSWISGDAVIDM